MTDCPATKEAVEELEEEGYGPGCELCGNPASWHSAEMDSGATP